MSHLTFYQIVLLLLLVKLVTAVLNNRTIDDEFGDSATKLVSNYSPAEG